MTLDNARFLLFSPATLHLLEQNKASSELISLIDLGMELEFVERIIPQDFPDSLSEIKSIALSVLQSLPESWEPEERWLAQSKKVKVTSANGYIVLVGIKDTVAVKAELESRDVVGACEASGNTIKVMVDLEFDLSDQNAAEWLMALMGRILSECNESGVDIQLHRGHQTP